MFEREIATYLRMKSGLPFGRVVLIHGEDLIGVFDSDAEAVREGTRRFGREPFLVRQVRAEEPVISNPALDLGILRAPAAY